MQYIIKDLIEDVYYDGSDRFGETPNIWKHYDSNIYKAWVFDSKESAEKTASILAKESDYITIIELY